MMSLPRTTNPMDPNPKRFPLLSYVISRLPSMGPRPAAAGSTSEFVEIDIEQPSNPLSQPDPSTSSSSSSSSPSPSALTKNDILGQMPRLTDPKVLASMTHAISDVAQTRSVLRALGERPDHEAVDAARSKLADIEANLCKQLEEILLSPLSSAVDQSEWRAHQAAKEKECRQSADKEKQVYKAIILLDEMHEAYQKLLKDGEERLVKIYASSDAVVQEGTEEDVPVTEEVNEEVVGILQEASGKGLERVDLSGRRLRFFPEAFGRIRSLLVLNISGNQLEVS